MGGARSKVGAAKDSKPFNGLGGATKDPWLLRMKRAKDMAGGLAQWATTQLEIETFSFHWSIKNYSTLSSEWIRSDTFKGGPKSGHEWQLKLCPRNKIEDTEYLSVYLILTGFGDSKNRIGRKVKARCQISLLYPDGFPVKQSGGLTKSVHAFRKGDSGGFGHKKFLKSTDVTVLIRRFMKDDVLRIHCRIWIEVDFRRRKGQDGEALNDDAEEVKRRGYEGLSSNLQELLSDPKFSDLAVSMPTQTFMVHKGILSARSSVFHTMLNANMLESAMNRIEIPDFEEDVVKAMLEYIYTGKTADLNEKAIDLMRISDMYDLGGLKEECSMALVRSLSVENAVDVLVLAHLHNASTLKGKVMDFINRNKEDVKETRSFKNLVPPNPNVTLVMDLYLSQ